MHRYFVVKLAQVQQLPFNSNAGHPDASFLVPSDPFELTACALSLRSICAVLRISARPKILPRVVQSVSILVIVLSRLWKTISACDHSVHADTSLSLPRPDLTHCVPANASIFSGIPLPLHEELVIFSGNSGKLSLRERNKAVSIFHVRSLAAGLFSDDRLPSSDLSEFSDCSRTNV